jgi:hypothetical protein
LGVECLLIPKILMGAQNAVGLLDEYLLHLWCEGERSLDLISTSSRIIYKASSN